MPNELMKTLTVGTNTYDLPQKTSDLTNDSGYITGMTILSYGNSTWADFEAAYNANKVVYCRASSNANPASGSQTRLAFMAYVNNATTPTNVEFQYYRSVSSHTASQQGDQVFVYKLDKTSGWSVTTREASVKVVAGDGLGGTYSNGTMTLAVSGAIPSDVTATTQTSTDNSTKIATTAFVNTAINAKATKTVLTATIAAADWTGSDPYTNTVSVSGLLATDTPVMDLVASSTYATAQNEIADYALIYKATCSANTLTVYATQAPSVDLSVQLVCVR